MIEIRQDNELIIDCGIEGPMGPQGPQGEKGDKGDQGIQGIQGPKGDTGATGATGAQGIQGLKGDKGETGERGPQGPQGEQGIQGEKGEQGPKGDKGDKGDKGEPGDVSEAQLESVKSELSDEIVLTREELKAKDKIIADLEYRLDIQEKLTKGYYWDEYTDSTEAYTKVIPAEVLDNSKATINSIGGKCIVEDGELITIACNEVEVKGKNFANFTINKPISFSNWSIVDNRDGTYTNTKSFGTGGFGGVVYNDIEVGTYTISLDILENTSTETSLNLYVEFDDGTSKALGTTHFALTNKRIYKTVTIDQKCKLIVRPTGRSGTNIVFTFGNIQLERGTEATDYSPYTLQQLPIPQAIQQLDGYGWSAGDVCNEIDYVNKKYIQRVGRVDLGSLNWTKHTSLVGWFRTSDSYKIYGSRNNALCSKYSTFIGSQPSQIGDKQILLDDVNTRIVCKDTDFADLSANTFRDANKGVYLYYELAEPIITDVTDLMGDFSNRVFVEPNGTITFKNTLGDDYKVPIPNSVTYVRDLRGVAK